MALAIIWESGNALESIVFDATTSVVRTFKSESTSNPVEASAGAPAGTVADHSIPSPDELRIESVLTDYPLTKGGGGVGGGVRAGHAATALETLNKLRLSGTLVRVENGFRVHANMLIQEIVAPQTTAKAVKVTIAFKAVRLVSSRTATIARTEVKTAQKIQNKGPQKTAPASDPVKAKSWLAKGTDGLVDGIKKIGSALKFSN